MSFESFALFGAAAANRTVPANGYVKAPDGSWLQFANGVLGVPGVTEAPSAQLPGAPGFAATPFALHKLCAAPTAAWDQAPQIAITGARKASLADFDKPAVNFKNYEVGSYFSQISLDAIQFKQCWEHAHEHNPVLNADLIFVASAAKRIANDWNPRGCESVIATAQNRFRDAHGDHFKYAEVSAALLNAVSALHGKPARFTPIAKTAPAPAPQAPAPALQTPQPAPAQQPAPGMQPAQQPAPAQQPVQQPVYPPAPAQPPAYTLPPQAYVPQPYVPPVAPPATQGLPAPAPVAPPQPVPPAPFTPNPFAPVYQPILGGAPAPAPNPPAPVYQQNVPVGGIPTVPLSNPPVPVYQQNAPVGGVPAPVYQPGVLGGTPAPPAPMYQPNALGGTQAPPAGFGVNPVYNNLPVYQG